MQDTDPQGFMLGLAGKLDDLEDRDEINGLLNELECIREVLEPELQEPAHQLTKRLRGKLDDAR